MYSADGLYTHMFGHACLDIDIHTNIDTNTDIDIDMTNYMFAHTMTRI